MCNYYFMESRKMNDDVLQKYNEYKQAKESGISNKEKYKLLSNFAATNPGDVNEFLDLLEGKKDLNQEKNVQSFSFSFLYV